ncbi:hypothetical protein DH2020_046416 [Rehmannia glutinosa]|uniref:Uncharacterized protein n=1 Tax=Rehmannia glutinosa TaxID=99300 RepID=A0ABR0UBC0_REHGL
MRTPFKESLPLPGARRRGIFSKPFALSGSTNLGRDFHLPRPPMVSLESAVDAGGEHGWSLMAVFVSFVVKSLSGSSSFDSPGWCSSSWDKAARRDYLGRRRVGWSPWGVAAPILLLLVMVR